MGEPICCADSTTQQLTSLHCLCLILLPVLCYILRQWIIWIRCTQQCLNAAWQQKCARISAVSCQQKSSIRNSQAGDDPAHHALVKANGAAVCHADVLLNYTACLLLLAFVSMFHCNCPHTATDSCCNCTTSARYCELQV